jgi:hypothetical protein
MDEQKTLKSKDTDITGVLVGILVVLVMVLIAKTAGDFANKPTSTATKAKFTTACPTNGQEWWGKTIGCPVAKVDNKCPAEYPVDDNTSTALAPSKDLQCFSTVVMDQYYNQDYESRASIGTDYVKRGNQYCASITGNSSAKCLASDSYDWDYKNKTWKNPNYSTYSDQPQGKCPLLIKQTNIYGASTYIVTKADCYLPK